MYRSGGGLYSADCLFIAWFKKGVIAYQIISDIEGRHFEGVGGTSHNISILSALL